jgi:hypothetical protein
MNSTALLDQLATRAVVVPLSPAPRCHDPWAQPGTSYATAPVGEGDGRRWRGVEMSNDATENLPALLSVPRAARLLGLSRASAYRYAATGELPTKRFGGRIYVITVKIRPLLDGTEEMAA